VSDVVVEVHPTTTSLTYLMPINLLTSNLSNGNSHEDSHIPQATTKFYYSNFLLKKSQSYAGKPSAAVLLKFTKLYQLSLNFHILETQRELM
jgi:hypothetical protein